MNIKERQAIMKDKEGYVYLICDPNKDAYKIGVTRRAQSQRIKKLQTGNPTQLHIVRMFQTKYPFRLETMLHFKYSNKKLINEWFDLSADDVTSFYDTCQQLNDTMLLLEQENPFFNNLK